MLQKRDSQLAFGIDDIFFRSLSLQEANNLWEKQRIGVCAERTRLLSVELCPVNHQTAKAVRGRPNLDWGQEPYERFTATAARPAAKCTTLHKTDAHFTSLLRRLINYLVSKIKGHAAL